MFDKSNNNVKKRKRGKKPRHMQPLVNIKRWTVFKVVLECDGKLNRQNMPQNPDNTRSFLY